MFQVSSIGRLLLPGVAAAMVVTACGTTQGATPSPSPVDVGSGSITGAGASFPDPFYKKAFYDYNQQHSQVTINYQAVGSGAGIKQFTANTVDFGASDVPMNPAEIAAAGGDSAMTQIPTTLGVISIAFNISGVDKLNLDADTLANIFLGKTKTWNDPAIVALNPGTTLPNKPITTVHRSDGSGTTFHFTDYLSKVSPEWKTKVGNAKAVSWPIGIAAAQNAGVAQAVTSTDGSIGYVELAYVVQTGMKQAALKNAAGKLVTASVAGATAAAAANTNVSPTNYSITNAPGDTSYPIAGFSWVMLKTSYTDANKGKAIVYLFKWLVSPAGQKEGADLQYAALPAAVQTLASTNLKLIKAGGSAVLS
jgi:phosphate transport system substrate-binding protein